MFAKLFSRELFILLAFSAQGFAAHADTITQTVNVQVHTGDATPSFRVATSVRAPALGANWIKLVSFLDPKGNTTTVVDTVSYIAETKTFKNDFNVLVTPPNSETAQIVATASTTCTQSGNEACRNETTNDKIDVGAESSVESAVPAQAALENLVEVAINSGKILNVDGTRISKTLEQVTVLTVAELGKATLVYSDVERVSDTPTQHSLSVQIDKDASKNLTHTFKGSDGIIALSATADSTAVFELTAKIPEQRFTFKRSLEIRPKFTPGSLATVVPGKNNLQGAIWKYPNLQFTQSKEVNVGATSLKYDSSGLKPDASQDKYEAGLGILVENDEATATDPALKSYWDVEAEAVGPLNNLVRTHNFKIINPSKSRTMRIRSKAGDIRAEVTVAETVNPSKVDADQITFAWDHK